MPWTSTISRSAARRWPVFIVTIGLATYCTSVLHQKALDRRLLAAIRQDQYAIAIDLLHAGASANSALDTQQHISLYSMLRRMLHLDKYQEPFKTPALNLLLRSANCTYRKDHEKPSNQYKVVAAELVRSGADINSSDEDGSTALMQALRVTDSYTCRLLLSRGAAVNKTDSYGVSALMCASEWGNVAIVRMLLRRGATVNCANSSGGTPLMYAALREETETVRVLCAAGAGVNVQDDVGDTALMRAAERGNEAIVRILLRCRAMVNRANISGETPLMYAVRVANTETVRVLCSAGADVRVQDNVGETALTIARKQQCRAIVIPILMRQLRKNIAQR